MSISQAINYRKVSTRIATAGCVNPAQLAQLAEEGIEVVINLLPEDNLDAVPDEQQIVEQQGIRYCHIPVDFAAPLEADYQDFKAFMDQVGANNLLIHCAANYRVSAFYSRYAVETRQWAKEEARHFIASIWDPQDYPGWPEILGELNDDE